jgi:S-adenosylmethionine/arginine decarboxylase-like enzyme
MEYWGKHYIANVTACNLEKARDPEHIRLFTIELVKRIDMKPYGTPQVIHFGEGDLGGWTTTQLIETSNIMGHFLDHNGDLYFDVFSCKDFEEHIITDMLNEWFEPEDINAMVLMRDARLA